MQWRSFFLYVIGILIFQKFLMQRSSVHIDPLLFIIPISLTFRQINHFGICFAAGALADLQGIENTLGMQILNYCIAFLVLYKLKSFLIIEKPVSFFILSFFASFVISGLTAIQRDLFFYAIFPTLFEGLIQITLSALLDAMVCLSFYYSYQFASQIKEFLMKTFQRIRKEIKRKQKRPTT